MFYGDSGSKIDGCEIIRIWLIYVVEVRFLFLGLVVFFVSYVGLLW